MQMAANHIPICDWRLIQSSNVRSVLNTDLKTNGTKPWFAITMAILSMTVGAISLNKVAPIASTIAMSMGLPGVGQTGLMISVFTVSGIFLSLPIGTITARIGCYKLGFASLAAITVGSAIGGMDVSYEIMLASRIIEGFGLVCMATLGPTIVGILVDDKHRGVVMGLMMCYMAFGQIIMLNCAPLIAASVGWKQVWWLNAVLAAVLAAVWLLCLRKLDDTLGVIDSINSGESDGSVDKVNKPSMGELLKDVLSNRAVWLTGISFMLYIVAEQATMGCFSQYLVQQRGMEESLAGSIVSIASIIGIPVGILAGVICDKLGSRKWPLAFLLTFSMVLYGATPLFPTDMMWLLSVLRGFAVMGVVGIYFSIGSSVVQPEQVSTSAGLLNTFQYIGLFMSTSLFGVLVDMFGWSMAFYLLVPPSLVGILCIVFLPKVK